jgi:hypothetical protein
MVDVAPPAGADVAGDARVAPAEVVDRRDVGEEVEAELVAQVRRRLEQPLGRDDDRRLAEGDGLLDEAGYRFERYGATSRIS